jgi:hypothetical protein
VKSIFFCKTAHVLCKYLKMIKNGMFHFICLPTSLVCPLIADRVVVVELLKYICSS